MKSDRVLGLVLNVLLPFVPVGYRTAGGVVLVVLGTALSALASPDLLGVLPAALAKVTPILQVWGAAAAALGMRAALGAAKR